MDAVVLAKAIRGGFTESVHHGHIVAVTGSGTLVASAGDPDFGTFTRSCSKFHQALPLIFSGAARHYGLVEEEIAVACSSHMAEPFHLRAVLSILEKAKLSQSQLRCGAHDPGSPAAASALICSGEKASALHNNCSGKHAGMLALASYLGADPDTYLEPDHPVQRLVMEVITTYSSTPESAIPTGIDGCSLPTYYLPLRKLALMFARLVAPGAEIPVRFAEASKVLIQAVANHPEMISSHGGIDAEIIRISGGNLVAKVGAEGVMAIGAAPSANWPEGLGIAFKVLDGTGTRVRPLVAIEILRHLGVLDEASLRQIEDQFPRGIFNCNNIRVGELQSVIRLD